MSPYEMATCLEFSRVLFRSSGGIIIGGYLTNNLDPRAISHRAQHRRIRVGDSDCPLCVRYLRCLNFCTTRTNENARQIGRASCREREWTVQTTGAGE